MKKLIAGFWFWLTGWKLDAPPELIRKCRHSVMIAAPHTTNWDFIYALFGFWLMGLDLKYFIKDSYTRSPLGWLFKYTGAMGVNRSHRNNLVEHCVDLLNHEPQLVVLIPAEGSRSRVDKWHTGFYHIALQSGVPVSLGYLDYKKKIAGVGKVFSLTGDFEKDMSVIQDFYQKVTPKYPEKYNPKIF